jgi:hypothetical protein
LDERTEEAGKLYEWALETALREPIKLVEPVLQKCTTLILERQLSQNRGDLWLGNKKPSGAPDGSYVAKSEASW